jgi:hypothetical protein
VGRCEIIVLASHVWTYERWDASVGAREGQHGITGKVWRSYDVDKHAGVEPAQRGAALTMRTTVATGGAARFGGGDPHDQPPPENHARVRRALNNVCTPAAFWIRQERSCPTMPSPTVDRHT